MYWTGIGSRGLSSYEKPSLFEIGREMARQDNTLISGGAEGADISFQRGACSWDTNLCEIWLPYNTFNKKDHITGCLHLVPDNEEWGVAERYLVDNNIIPWWGKMKHTSKIFHIRNYYQIFGLDHKSELVIYCADEKNRNVSGGTRTAVEIARFEGIPTCNIRYDNLSDYYKNGELLCTR